MEEQQAEQVYTEPTNGDEAYQETQETYQEQNHYEEPQQEAAEPEPQPTEYQEPRPDRRDDDDRKIFVGGLSWETTVKDLREYFTKFGEVSDCTLKTDAVTGRSRGFGFVTFTEESAVDKVCAQQEHTLHGRTIDPKRAKARGRPEPVKKVFVGGLDDSISAEDLKEHFSKYGKVVDMDLPYDKFKQQRRAFCFITFEHESIVETVVADPRQSINGREVDVKKATPRQDQYWAQQGWPPGGAWGDRGGRGGRGGFDRGRGRGRGRGDYGRGGPPPHQQGWGNQGWGQGGYDYGYYGQPNYDYSGYYSQGYNNYGNGYDYSGYYGQGYYPQGYGGQSYDQSGYDYSSWYAQQGQQQQQTQQSEHTDQSQSGYKAKAPSAAPQRGGAQYHPYQRQ